MFRPQPGINFTVDKRDLANVLSALEPPPDARSDFQQGWFIALRRVAIAFGLDYIPPEATTLVIEKAP